MTIGRYTYDAPTVKGEGKNKITIGSFCSIGKNVVLDSGIGHNTRNISTFPMHLIRKDVKSNVVVKGDITIGNDVWIGDSVTIMSGTSVGHGSVIGRNCIVSKDVAPYEVVVGAPQKVLRKRFSDSQIEELLKIKWWEWSDEKIFEHAHEIASENIDEFIQKHKI